MWYSEKNLLKTIKKINQKISLFISLSPLGVLLWLFSSYPLAGTGRDLQICSSFSIFFFSSCPTLSVAILHYRPRPFEGGKICAHVRMRIVDVCLHWLVVVKREIKHKIALLAAPAPVQTWQIVALLFGGRACSILEGNWLTGLAILGKNVGQSFCFLLFN